jgi:hypothetical protein
MHASAKRNGEIAGVPRQADDLSVTTPAREKPTIRAKARDAFPPPDIKKPLRSPSPVQRIAHTRVLSNEGTQIPSSNERTSQSKTGFHSLQNTVRLLEWLSSCCLSDSGAAPLEAHATFTFEKCSRI